VGSKDSNLWVDDSGAEIGHYKAWGGIGRWRLGLQQELGRILEGVKGEEHQKG
jgi:hypothetical protein